MSDRILGAACVVLSVAMAWAAHDYAAPISYEPVGPRAFPLLLAALLAIGGGWLAIKPGTHASGLRFVHLKTLGLAALAVFGYALLFELLGFTLATAAMAVPVGMAFGGNWKQSLAGGVGLGVALYLLFDKLLDVVLPTGVLSVLLGGH
jgi:putative tricarboxylic transport membrane protein